MGFKGIFLFFLKISQMGASVKGAAFDSVRCGFRVGTVNDAFHKVIVCANAGGIVGVKAGKNSQRVYENAFL